MESIGDLDAPYNPEVMYLNMEDIVSSETPRRAHLAKIALGLSKARRHFKTHELARMGNRILDKFLEPVKRRLALEDLGNMALSFS